MEKPFRFEDQKKYFGATELLGLIVFLAVALGLWFYLGPKSAMTLDSEVNNLYTRACECETSECKKALNAEARELEEDVEAASLSATEESQLTSLLEGVRKCLSPVQE